VQDELRAKEKKFDFSEKSNFCARPSAPVLLHRSIPLEHSVLLAFSAGGVTRHHALPGTVQALPIRGLSNPLAMKRPTLSTAIRRGSRRVCVNINA
jgi:hypothetical protein